MILQSSGQGLSQDPTWHKWRGDTPEHVPQGSVPRAYGRAKVRVSCLDDARTVVKERFSAQPYRLLTPAALDGEPVTVVLSNLSGGMLNGDRYDFSVQVDAGADVLITGQAAEKIYKAADERAVYVRNRLTIATGANVEWIPQGTIQFDGARMDRLNLVDVAAGATTLCGELLYLGRHAMGETFQSGLLRDRWRVYRDGRLTWQDQLRLDDQTMAALTHNGGLRQATLSGLLFVVADDVGGMLTPVREVIGQVTPDDPSGDRVSKTAAHQAFDVAATMVNGILVVRWLGTDAQAIRTDFGRVAGWLRSKLMGRPDVLPHLWHI